MPILILSTTDPYLNLATEEVLFRNFVEEEDLFLLWQSKPAFIIGRNQNPYLEIDPRYRKDIPVIRRISGGGTIYSDMGTLNFSYITNDFKSKVNNYQYFLEPIIEALRSYGLEVSFQPKSHLFLKNAKISGNAQAFQNNVLLHHGTLLYDTNLDIIKDALIAYNPDSSGHQISSNKQWVVNLKEYLPDRVSIDDIKKSIISSVKKGMEISNRIFVLSENDQMDIVRLANEKYKSWNWNYGKTQLFDQHIIYGGEEFLVTIDKGIIINTSPYKESWIGKKYDAIEK
ncbi:MAG: lipoate--protein ligase family protein [Bacilli bacterium]|nr:lipoate--protein ligase family protein [Bacilli bacterium]MBN2877689.1 lipoate--protein ligase family protein [Bacilli bacterium]